MDHTEESFNQDHLGESEDEGSEYFVKASKLIVCSVLIFFGLFSIVAGWYIASKHH